MKYYAAGFAYLRELVSRQCLQSSKLKSEDLTSAVEDKIMDLRSDMRNDVEQASNEVVEIHLPIYNSVTSNLLHLA